MVELLWLLLPAAAASGWAVGRRGTRSSRLRRASTPGWNADYFKGLNYLLNEEPDKAIEVFIQLVEVDSDTIETHFALGTLFRRRGEVDRAIRIHQNLIARPILTRDQRARALFALGEDYMGAGLLDRAENLFEELLNMNAHTDKALRNLIQIYEREKEWEQAITTAGQLQRHARISTEDIVAQYYCELADEARHAGRRGEAIQYARHALASDSGCVRASILEGDLEAGAGNDEAAIRAYRRIEAQDIEYLPEVVGALEACYRRRDELGVLVEYLHGLVVRYPALSPMLALAELLRERDGDRAAVSFLTEQLQRRPSVRGLNRLVELYLRGNEGPTQDDLYMLRDLTHQLLENKPVYICNQCGFGGKTMHWQCPTCRNWNAVKPVQGVEGE